MAILESVELSRYFGGLPAVDGLSFGVEPGEILGVIGPNGAGKTTLLNLVSGLLPLSQGEIRFQGQVISGRPPHTIAAAGIARTFQIVKPLRGLTVRENVALGAMFGRSGRRMTGDARARAREVLDVVGLTARADSAVTALTIADLKRLELGRAQLGQQLALMQRAANGALQIGLVDRVTGATDGVEHRA